MNSLLQVFIPSLIRATFQLFVDAQELAMKVVGEDDGAFDADDYLEFYAIGMESNFSNTRAYWLVTGTTSGRRIGQAKSTRADSAPSSFAYTSERRDRTTYFAALRNGETENFFGSIVAASPLAQTLFTPHIASQPGANAALEIALQGVTNVAHEVMVSLNGSEIGRLTFAGQSRSVAAFNFSHSLLNEGANTFTLTRLGAASDISLVDYLRVTYQRRFAAERPRAPIHRRFHFRTNSRLRCDQHQRRARS
jgi:hypothetical protein